MALNEDRAIGLERQVDKLKNENLKLSTDIKIIRNEHSEILHKVVNLDRKNQQLLQENEQIRRHVGLAAVEISKPVQVLEESSRYEDS